MKIYFSGVGLFRRLAIKKLLNNALKYLGQPSDLLEMALAIVSPEEIRQFNKDFREVDRVTDVLSFPTADNPTRGAITVVCEEVNPETGLVNIGDVVICLQKATEQAKEYGHSLKRELSFLALHGLLHLLGYDHLTEEDEKQMVGLQKEILTQAKILR